MTIAYTPLASIPHRPVNVASVPKRSPFRYPGGKTWFVPWARKWLSEKSRKPQVLVEPFAGGAIIGLTTAFELLASRVILVELDDDVASVWQTILSTDSDWLARQIRDFRLDDKTATAVLESQPASTKERAFHTMLRNRVSHGGILAAGSGWVKNGENGRGLKSRWYPETLSCRILEIAKRRDRIKFFHCDGVEILKAHAARKDTVFFIDPPYTAAGKKAGTRLYTHSQLDHPKLFDLAASFEGDFLMTYDLAEDVATMALDRGFDLEQIPMKNTHHANMTELLIGRDLAWARSVPIP